MLLMYFPLSKMIFLMLFSHLQPNLPSGRFTRDSSILATCLAHRSFKVSTIVTILNELSSLSFSLCSVLNCSLISSFLFPNIFLDTFFKHLQFIYLPQIQRSNFIAIKKQLTHFTIKQTGVSFLKNGWY